MANELTTSGIAHLCFLEDDSGFHGILVTENHVQYGLLGTENKDGLNNKHFHRCCHDGTPTFYNIKVIDHMAFDDENEHVLCNVLRTGGDNCTLTSERVSFITDQLFVGAKAEKLIEKYFSPKLLNKNCYICVGTMTVTKADDQQ